jgi:hypothetical protein
LLVWAGQSSWTRYLKGFKMEEGLGGINLSKGRGPLHGWG